MITWFLVFKWKAVPMQSVCQVHTTRVVGGAVKEEDGRDALHGLRFCF